MNLKQYYGKKVKIVADNDKVFLGKVNDYFYPDKNENGKESIVVDTIFTYRGLFRQSGPGIAGLFL